MKTFGIFLAFPPEVDLRAEGLGRYLGEFLNEAKERPDARFAIACPSWMKKSLYDLFERVGIPQTAFEVISPKDRPIILRLYEAYRIYARRKRRRYFPQLVDYLINQKIQLISRAERTMATTRSLLLFVVLILLAAPFVAVAYAVRQLRALLVSIFALSGLRRIWRSVSGGIMPLAARLALVPQNNPLTLRLYRFMEEAEARLLCDQINSRKEIAAWYTPGRLLAAIQQDQGTAVDLRA